MVSVTLFTVCYKTYFIGMFTERFGSNSELVQDFFVILQNAHTRNARTYPGFASRTNLMFKYNYFILDTVFILLPTM